jgi:formamidopyrimidine-DNA glycosylase
VPEGLEVEIYRRAAAGCLGRTVRSIEVDERQEMAHELRSVVPGSTIMAARRIGKLLLLDLNQAGARTRDGESGTTLGLHFGMTGRLVVDGNAPIGQLEYGSGRDEPAWDRLLMRFEDGGVLRVNDPRRWARFTLDPNLDRLGHDLFDIDAEALAASFARRRAPTKAVLLDQAVIAGLGNLCVDEVLWQAGISPLVPAQQLNRAALERVVVVLRQHLPVMLDRGGSHRGELDPDMRSELPPCPRDGAALKRATVGGRTTVWCPVHQRADAPG